MSRIEKHHEAYSSSPFLTVCITSFAAFRPASPISSRLLAVAAASASLLSLARRLLGTMMTSATGASRIHTSSSFFQKDSSLVSSCGASKVIL